MSAVPLLPPNQYKGQDLCERCGVDSTGHYFAICHNGYEHEESCRLYRYHELCAKCEATLTETEK